MNNSTECNQNESDERIITSNAQHLLDQAKILNSYNKLLAAKSGENFNIFNVLNNGRVEAVHNAILRELLDPDGSHSFAQDFLKEFLKILKISESDFDPIQAKVISEKHIGNISEDYEEGGRIDILIEESNNSIPRYIIIEIKIGAPEQKNQMSRYAKSYPKAHLVYLTLGGSKPTNESNDKVLEKLKCISYKTDMIEWLTICQRIASDAPIVRETIKQYINIIKELTNQNINTQMNQDIIDKVTNDSDTYRAYCLLVAANQDVHRRIINNFYKRIRNEIDANKIELLEDASTDDRHLFYTTGDLRKHKLKFGIEFTEDYTACIFGFFRYPEDLDRKEIVINDLFKQHFKCDVFYSRWWQAYTKWNRWNHNTLQSLPSGPIDILLKDLIYIFEIMKSIADEYCNGINNNTLDL